MRRSFILFVISAAVVLGGWYFVQAGGVDWAKRRLESFSDGQPDSSVAAEPPPITRSEDSIKLASFNIQVFGTTKAQKAYVMDILARIVRKFDVVAIQEIRSKDQSLLPQFVDIVNATGRYYDYAIGPRLGRSSSKEQYAFIFDRASVELDRHQLYTVEDPDDLLHREPYVAWFRVRGPPKDQAFTFTLVNIHTDPDEVNEELKWLDDVFRNVRDDGREEDDVILLGDLNADDRHLGELGRMPGATWVISGIPTNTRGTAQYDNIIFHEAATSEFTGRGGVLDFLREFNLSIEEALEISDHLPVWAEFSIYEGGTPGQIARLK